MNDVDFSTPEQAMGTGHGPTSLDPQNLAPARPISSLGGVRLGISAARARLFRRPTWLSIALGFALIVVATVIERRVGSAGAVDRVLGTTFRVIIPLVTFGIASAAAGHERLRDAVWSLARYGAVRRDLALGTLLAAIVTSAGLAAIFAVVSVVLAHTPAAPALLHDATQSAWIGALTASAYTAWFSVGAVFWKRGRGRWIPLVLDLALGGSTGLLGVVFPRGHAENLLGASAPMLLSQPTSSAILALSAVALTLLASLSCRE